MIIIRGPPPRPLALSLRSMMLLLTSLSGLDPFGRGGDEQVALRLEPPLTHILP